LAHALGTIKLDYFPPGQQAYQPALQSQVSPILANSNFMRNLPSYNTNNNSNNNISNAPKPPTGLAYNQLCNVQVRQGRAHVNQPQQQKQQLMINAIKNRQGLVNPVSFNRTNITSNQPQRPTVPSDQRAQQQQQQPAPKHDSENYLTRCTSIWIE
jgi:hypothetical protein